MLFTVWKSVYEPKYYDRSYFIIYSLFVVAGVLLLITAPDATIIHAEVGISILIGVFFTVGGLTAITSLSKGVWYKERAGIYFITGGLLSEFVGTVLDSDSPIERFYYALFVAIMILLIMIRRYRIKDYFFDPTKG